METDREENENKKTIWERVMIFYNKNKKELLVVLCLLIVYNFICPVSYESIRKNRQLGGDNEEAPGGGGGSGGSGGDSGGSGGDAAGAEKAAKGTGMNGKKKGLIKSLKGVNVLQKVLGWMLSFVQSLLTFAGLVLVLAVLPGLPIFIFMLILFFILRARVAALKAY
jgi:hypothetical protein